MKCGRPAYSFSSVADGALLCSFRIFRFSETGLMWSALPAISRSGGRFAMPDSTEPGEPSASKNGRFVPGMYCSS
jgi:hypothetical protein